MIFTEFLSLFVVHLAAEEDEEIDYTKWCLFEGNDEENPCKREYPGYLPIDIFAKIPYKSFEEPTYFDIVIASNIQMLRNNAFMAINQNITVTFRSINTATRHRVGLRFGDSKEFHCYIFRDVDIMRTVESIHFYSCTLYNSNILSTKDKLELIFHNLIVYGDSDAIMQHDYEGGKKVDIVEAFEFHPNTLMVIGYNSHFFYFETLEGMFNVNCTKSNLEMKVFVPKNTTEIQMLSSSSLAPQDSIELNFEEFNEEQPVSFRFDDGWGTNNLFRGSLIKVKYNSQTKPSFDYGNIPQGSSYFVEVDESGEMEYVITDTTTDFCSSNVEKGAQSCNGFGKALRFPEDLSPENISSESIVIRFVAGVTSTEIDLALFNSPTLKSVTFDSTQLPLHRRSYFTPEGDLDLPNCNFTFLWTVLTLQNDIRLNCSSLILLNGSTPGAYGNDHSVINVGILISDINLEANAGLFMQRVKYRKLIDANHTGQEHTPSFKATSAPFTEIEAQLSQETLVIIVTVVGVVVITGVAFVIFVIRKRKSERHSEFVEI